MFTKGLQWVHGLGLALRGNLQAPLTFGSKQTPGEVRRASR